MNGSKLPDGSPAWVKQAEMAALMDDDELAHEAWLAATSLDRVDVDTGAALVRPACDPADEAVASQFSGDKVRSIAAAAKPEPEPRARFAFVPIGEFLSEITAPKWLIRDIVEQDSLLMIFGDPESGKSFLAMDWAASVATGREWQGCPVRQGPVLYINGEGRNGVNRRFTAWAIANQVDLAAAPLFLSTMTTALTDDMARAELEAVIAEFVRVHGEPVLIVIDTLARNYGPGDENSTQDMSRAIATCDAIRDLTHAAVALVHHSGHTEKGRARGAMALRGALDAEFRMQRVPEAKETTFECTKMKDAEHPNPMQFRFCSVELGVDDDHGRPVTSAILRPTEYAPADEGGAGMPKRGQPVGRGKHQKAALDALVRRYEKNLANVTRNGRDPEEARVSVEVWRDICMDAGMPRQRFADALATLKNAGRIRVEYGFAFPGEDE